MKPREYYETQMSMPKQVLDGMHVRNVEMTSEDAWKMIIELLLDIRDLLVPPPEPKIPTTFEYIFPYPPKTLEQKLAYVFAWITKRKNAGVVKETLIQILRDKGVADAVQTERLLAQLIKTGRIYFDAHNGRLYPS